MNCRHCSAPLEHTFLDLGFAPPSNAYLSEADLSRCAEEYDVIVCPMSLFSLGGGHDNQIRLSFSYVTPVDIERGIASLSRFLLAEMAAKTQGKKNLNH